MKKEETQKKIKKRKKNSKHDSASLFGAISNIALSTKEWINPILSPSSSGNNLSNNTECISIAATCWYVLYPLSITASKILLSSSSTTNASVKPMWLAFQ